MLDRLPLPNITAQSPEEQLMQMKDYLFQFKEELEFILSNISAENLSQDLIKKLNDIGADISTARADTDERLQQIGTKNKIVQEVVKSEAFADAVKENSVQTFTVNYETGNLDYE